MLEWAARFSRPPLRPVLNATGVVIHTNLGRAPLAPEAADAVKELSVGYSNLEYDVDAGKRGTRHDHVVPLLRSLTGAEDAVVVNNNAAAVLLTLSALAAGKGVVVSRGELVEIGGGFRIPDVMTQGGATLVEVGTTNKTHPYDYELAIDDTGMLLKVHPSNFEIRGFVAEVSIETLALGPSPQYPLGLRLRSGLLQKTAVTSAETSIQEASQQVPTWPFFLAINSWAVRRPGSVGRAT